MNKTHLKFQLRKDRANANGLYPIYLYANINGSVKYFSINHSVPEKAWNEKKQEVSTSHPLWQIINNDIARYRSKANQIRIDADSDDEKISLYQFEKVFRSGAKDMQDIFSFIEEDIRQFWNTYAPDTIKMYKSQSNKLKKFRNELKFNEITPFFWKSYDSYLINLNNNENTRWKAFRVIKTFIRKAIEVGLIKTDPLQGVRVKKPDGNRQFLTQEELKLLGKMYSGFMTKDLKTVLQYFLFSCLTSLRFSDVKHLKNSNLFLGEEDSHIFIIQRKTKKAVEIPLSKKAIKYLPPNGLPNQNVFDVYSNQATNRILKDIIKLAKISKSISFHCARHTFATIALELSGNIAVVSNLLGHAKISSTQIYAKVLESSKRKIVNMFDTI